MRRSSRIRGKRVNYSEEAMVTAYEKKAGAELTYKPKQKLYVPKPIYRKRLPPAPRPKFVPRKLRPKLTEIERDELEIDYKQEEVRTESETAEVRLAKIREMKPVKRKPRNRTNKITRKRRHLLFMNPGETSVQVCILSFVNNKPLPAWAVPFRQNLRFNKNIGRLIWIDTEHPMGIPFALFQDKRDAVKKLYFDPREPSTIQPITEKLYEIWANINRRNVTYILKSLETYQLNFGRRRPPDLKNRFFMRNPGMIVMDMFFPSTKDIGSISGWAKTNVLCCADSWSRYCGVYAIDTKRMADVMKAMRVFLEEFASMGHLPRRILTDKGTDMKGAYTVIEPYRQAKDGTQPMVLHTATGTPVLLIEALNAQVQRRMQVFRTSGLIDEASQIVHEIAYQINHQPRPDRGNLTPIQLLSLDSAGRAQINSLYRDRTVPKAEIHGLPSLNVNDTVRKLMMTRKEQETNKTKGFAPKWSEELYTVLRKTALRKNEFAFRYDIGLPDTFYRHELLKIHGDRVDNEVPNQYVRYREVVFGGYDPNDDEEWTHDDA